MLRKTLKYILVVLVVSCISVTVSQAQEGISHILTLETQRANKEVETLRQGTALSIALDVIEASHNVAFLYEEHLLESKTLKRKLVLSDDVFSDILNVIEDYPLALKQLDARIFGIIRDRTAEESVYDETITGTVTDNQGESLPGVNIVIKGTTQGTSSGANGEFEMQVPTLQDTLVFSFIGFHTLEVPINGRTELNVRLQPQTYSGEELVVVGYGEQEKTTLTGAVSSVSLGELKEARVANFSNTLAGKLSGIVTLNSSGEPGYDGASIRIRGNHSLNNNEPLVVIDGVPNRAGGLDRLDPNDIQSISILKDATAAIYGSEAANGVILITTKSGRREMAPEFSVSFDQGFNQPTRIPEMANAATYATMLNEISLYEGQPAEFTQEQIQGYSDPNSDPWLYPDTDWFNEALKPISLQTKGNMAVQGGTENLSYYISLGGQTQDGYYRNSATRYNQGNFRANFENQLSKNINLTLNLGGRLEDRNFPTVGAGPTFRMLMRGKPTDPAYFPNGLPGPDIENGEQPVVTGTTQTGYDRDQRWFLNSDLGLNVLVPGINGLEISGRVSFDKQFRDRKLWRHPWTLYDFDKAEYSNKGGDPEQYLTASKKGPSEPELEQYYYQQYTILGNLVANYRHTFEDHDVSLMIGTERQQFKESDFGAYRRDFISTAIDQLFAGGSQNWSNGGGAAHGARQNYFGRFNYQYMSKYLFEVVARYDGSYLFPESGRYGFFPAFSAGWRLTQEDWFQESTGGLFDELKLRASWGKTGNDILDSNRLVQERQYLAAYQFGGGYVFNGQDVKSIYQASTPNTNVTWEKSSKLDIGFDAVLLDQRLSFTFDYWNELRTDILITRNASIPASTGLNLPRENLGEVRSWGYDGSISYDHPVNQNLSFSTKLNAGWSTDKIEFWDETPGAPEWQKSTGHKMNTGLYYNVIGVFQDQKHVDSYPHWDGARPGDLIYEDLDGNGRIDADDRIRIEKNRWPDFNGGLTLSAAYKQFDMSVFFQWATGAVQYVSTESGNFGNYFNDYAQNRWRPDMSSEKGMKPAEGGPFTWPRAYQRADQYWSPMGEHANTFWLRSTDYIRLKTLEIGYNLPVDLSTKAGIKRLRIYANGFNLLTWDKFKLMDPESNNASGAYYPQTRVVNIGMNLTF